MAEQINDRTDEEQMIEENTNIRSYLTFIANGLTYGVDTMHVVEIITDYSIPVSYTHHRAHETPEHLV